MNFPETIRLCDDAVVILDQSQLPAREEYLRLESIGDVWAAIRELKVRGAPAIGIAAAMGIYIHVRHAAQSAKDIGALTREFCAGCDYLASSRPTAVNLGWALERMKAAFGKAGLSDAAEILKNEAEAILREDAEVCKRIGEFGAILIKPGAGILTHCNAGSLAASKYGTALAPIYVAREEGKQCRVYAGETRPVLQGARLTAFELQKAGIDVTLICDSMAAAVMSKGLVDMVFVGCDRVARNGDTANKIGTLGIAVLAKNYGIPLYVCAPMSTIDVGTPCGSGIVIEERDGGEITEMWYRQRMAPEGVKTFNPSFDVTPAEFVTGFVTENGILLPPFGSGLES